MGEQNNVSKSLAHTKWNCKYHIVFAPKFAIPVRKFHVPKFLKYHQTTLSFQVPHKTGNANFGRYT